MRQGLTLLTRAHFSALARDAAPLLSLAQREAHQLNAQQRALLERLFEQLNERLYRFSLKRCGSPDVASDVTQEALMVILRRLPELSEEVSLLPWSFGVARMIYLKRSAREGRVQGRSLDDDDISEPISPHLSDLETPEALAAQSSEREELARAIQSLEPLYREVLLLRDVEGLSAAEAALVVDASVSAVKSRLHRARAELRVALTSQTPPPPLPADCPDIRRVFSEHLEGDLKPSLCAEMESHVRACLICAQECDDLKATMSICSSTPSHLPPALADKLRAQLRAWLRRHPSSVSP